MRLTINVALCGILLGFGLSMSGAMAQSGLRPPAELPPASFSGAQYVDSTGCIYVRAGSAGAVQWVPRVTRDRRQVCGFEPSFAASGTRVVPATVAPVVQSTNVTTETEEVPSGYVVLAGNATVEGVALDTRILPKHLYDRRKSLRPVKTPKGYRPAWQDGRMNPRRAEGTIRGQDQMNQIWTQTVPRRLIVQE